MTNRLGLVISLFLSSCLWSLNAAEQTRALWVSRWDYNSKSDIDEIMLFAADLGFNSVLFQVRGSGAVTYPSKIELQSETFRDQDWDPLLEAIKSAHARDLQLHAWVNVFPGWNGQEPPTNNEQLFNKKPSWFMYDVYGQPQELHNGYLFLSPTHPDVRKYLQELCEEIYTTYDIDGIHFDYIRFPAAAYSYDPVSVGLFEKLFSAKPQERPVAWQLWRQNNITSFVEAVYRDIKFVKPNVIVSAAVVSDRDRARDIYFQDGCDWLGRGIIDALYPMLYSDENRVFQQELEEYLINSHGRHIYPGIRVTNSGWVDKLQIAQNLGARGLAIFSYSDLVNNSEINKTFESATDSLWANTTRPAPMPWKIYTKDNFGPTISQIQTIPSPLRPFTPFKIVAKISDPSGVYDDMSGQDGQGVYVEFDTLWPPATPASMMLSKIEKTRDWYICDADLPGQAAGSIVYARISAQDDYHESLNNPKRNVGHSNVEHFPVVQPKTSFEYAGEIGPILWRPGAIAVDGLHQIWVTTEKNGPVVVLDSTGAPLDFSPIQTGMDGDYRSMSMTNVVGFARGAFNDMLVACNTNPPTIFRFNIQDGEALPGTQINFTIGKPDTLCAFCTDSCGNMYLLEKGSARWFILSPTGDDFLGMPYGDPQKSGSDIAVLGNGAMVFVTDRSSSVVQCWHGATEAGRSQYWRATDFLPSTVGLGKIYIEGNDRIYICNSRYGFIAEYDRVGNLLGHITGENSTMIAPQAMYFSPKKDMLYITEVVGEGPGRVKRWRQKQ